MRYACVVHLTDSEFTTVLATTAKAQWRQRQMSHCLVVDKEAELQMNGCWLLVYRVVQKMAPFFVWLKFIKY